MQTYTVNEQVFDSMDSEEQWYWLGFILGDGCIFTRRNEWRLQVRLRADDGKHLETLRAFLQFGGALHLECEEAALCLVVYSRGLCARLIDLGVVPNKSFGGHPMPTVPNRFTFAFLRGHFDANGHVSQVSPNGYKLGFSGQHRLMRWVQERLRHLVGVSPGLFYDKGGCAELVYGRREQVRAIARWLYGFENDALGVPRLSRKRVRLEPVIGAAA